MRKINKKNKNTSELLKKIQEKCLKNGYNIITPAHTIKNSFYFEHAFAKAFWGEEYLEVVEQHKAKLKLDKVVKTKNNSNEPQFDYTHTWTLKFKKWEFHLREIVLEEKPLKYLERFV